MKNVIYIIILIVLLAGCKKTTDEPDAWGNFEAREIMISSESSGKIISFPVEKGNVIRSEQLLAVIDTAIIKLQLAELDANAGSIKSKLPAIDAQNRIIDQQIKNLQVNITRIENMLRDKAATQKQMDDLTGQVEVLEKQKEANNTQKTSVYSELKVLEAKRNMLKEQLLRCFVLSPQEGTVLEKYAEAGEITAAGKPVLKIADLTKMELKVYIDGGQLGSVKLNQKCTVRIDEGEKGYRSLEGEIIHISNKAEFTPKIIQTKEERVHMVYAVTVLVQNDGALKSGMPGEVILY